MAQFKVGDKVRIKGDADNQVYAKTYDLGGTLEISEINTEWETARFREKSEGAFLFRLEPVPDPALISMDKKYRTRDGREVRVLAVDAIGDFPVVALVTTNGGEYANLYDSTGAHPTGQESPNDLIEAKPKHSGWINIYASGHPGLELASGIGTKAYTGTEVFVSRALADSFASTSRRRDRIACIHVEFAEGEGL